MSRALITVACLAFAAVPVHAQDIAAQAQALLRDRCAKCHNGPGSDSGLGFDVLKVATLTQKSDEGGPYVVPKAAEESTLLRMIQPGGRMPLSGKKLTAEEIGIISKWIEDGAPEFGKTESKRPFIPFKDVLQAIDDHLRQAPEEQRSSLRYFTLANIHNDPSLSDADLDVYRAALVKGVNSLSWYRRLARLYPIDPRQTTFALDMRHVRWDSAGWREVMKAYPYGLTYERHADERVRSLDTDIRKYSGGLPPYVRADWFLANATQPPLYHYLLRLPRTVYDLEQKLDVNVRQNFQSDMLMRAAFRKSNVSNQNRLVERHDSSYGALWISYDFKPRNPRGDLLQLPLGPLNLFPAGKHPYARSAFEHDGGELIFNLPNQLQAYLLVDGKGDRLDGAAPDDVVKDSSGFLGTNRIFNGISCMNCHAKGMIALRGDEVRDGFAKQGADMLKVSRLYPPRPVMNKQLQEDSKRFLSALRDTYATMGVYFNTDAEFDKYVDGPEPVGKVASTYLTKTLDLAAAAREVDLPTADDLLKKIGQDGMRRLGMGGLLQEGGVMTRQDWDTVGARSLMQRTAEEMGATSFKVTQ